MHKLLSSEDFLMLETHCNVTVTSISTENFTLSMIPMNAFYINPAVIEN